MSTHRIDAIEHSVHTIYTWLAELDDILGWDHRQRTYRLLRAVLHALRDMIPVAEVADLGAQLPLLVRGIYYEGWRGVAATSAHRHKADFITALQTAFKTDPLDDCDAVARAVFAFLETKISAGEIADVRHALPRDVRDMWPH